MTRRTNGLNMADAAPEEYKPKPEHARGEANRMTADADGGAIVKLTICRDHAVSEYHAAARDGRCDTSRPTKERVMRRVFYAILFVVVIVSWGVFAQQRKTQVTAGPAQAATSIESEPAAK